MSELVMTEFNPVVSKDDAPEVDRLHGEHYGSRYKVLTPQTRDVGGKLGVNLNRLPVGRALCPFHHHALEDEAFYILSGSGYLRYGETITAIGPGDCISCPAGLGTAHQIVNSGSEELVYLAIGNHEKNEICVYPDSDKVMVRSLQKVGRMPGGEYMAHEPIPPKILGMVKGD